jgi:hypothetical protein
MFLLAWSTRLSNDCEDMSGTPDRIAHRIMMRKQFLRHKRALVASIWQTVLFYVASCGIVSTASIGIYKAYERARLQEENAQLRRKLEVNEKVEQKLIERLTYSELLIKYLHTAEAANAAKDTARAKAALENVKRIEAAKEGKLPLWRQK